MTTYVDAVAAVCAAEVVPNKCAIYSLLHPSPTYVHMVAGVGAAEAWHGRHPRTVDGKHVFLTLRRREKSSD